jgi:hypothetical protein
MDFFPIPNTVIEPDPNPGTYYVIYVPNKRLLDLTTIISNFKGVVTVPVQPLNDYETYLTVMIPYGRTRDFTDNLYEEGIRWIGALQISRIRPDNRGR